jgi:hypothetical protein
MKNKTLYSLFLILAVFVTSCTLPDNIDPKSPKTVSPNALFTQAEYALFQQVAELDYNLNCSRFLAQYLSEVTYTNETRYNFSDRQVPDNFSGILYRDVLLNLKDVKQQVTAKAITPSFTEGIQKNQLAITNFCEIYAYHVLVDQFGNVPYSEALMGAENSRPVYDDALTIYKDLITRLNTVIADLDETAGGFGVADILYNDDIVLWKKLAASLKLRIALRMSDVPTINSSAMVSEALAAGVFTDQAESAVFNFYGIAPYVNPYYHAFVLDARKDFCPTNTIIDKMNALSDPRRAVWFTEYPAGAYTGLPYGKSGSSSYSKFSHLVDNIRIDPEYPAIVMDYVEVEFLLAEAAERSLGGVTGAATHYNNAILASMAYWGVSDADAATYLARADVAYSTATGTYKQKIGTQKWLGLFDRGVEAWAEWRRFDFPILTVPPGLTYGDIPLRMPYPFNENKMNKVNYDAASTAIGGDEVSTKLFWDKY